MPKTIELKKKAGELREQAHAKQEELKAAINKQLAGELAEGETRLTHAEIAERTKEVRDLMAEAKAIEDVESLDGIMSRPADQRSGQANALVEALNLINSGAVEGKDVPTSPFRGIGEFFRGVRVLAGPSEMWTHSLTEPQRKWMQAMWRLATVYERGDDVYMEEKKLFGEGGEAAVDAMKQLEAKTIVGTASDVSGGEHLVPTEYMTRMLEIMGEQQVFINRAFHVPMTRRTISFPRLKQTDVADTRPLFSFAAITKVSEGGEKPEREPTFEQFPLTAVKYAAYVEGGDELLAESIVAVPPVLVRLLTNAIAYEYDRDGMRGSGSGEPQGFVGSAAEMVCSRKTASQVNLDDVFAMESRFFGGTGMYLHHPSVFPQLAALNATNVIVWNPDLATRAPATLLGRPLVRTHKLPVLGTKGDFCLVDPQYYLAGDLQRITVASSMHYKFRNDITAWRAVFRAAGSPWPAAPFSSESSGTAFTFRVSPFVVLGAVATS
jgi:HK97 family phage major capsid protein